MPSTNISKAAVNDMVNIFLFKNCFTGAISGGGMHSSDVFGYLNKAKAQNLRVGLIHPSDDKHLEYYPALQNVIDMEFRAPKFIKNFAILFLLRALYCTLFLSLKKYTSQARQNIFVASSHFIPDVVPIIFKSLFLPNKVRAVYIHHIIQEMNRPKNLNNTLANLQEQLCFFLIRRFYDKIFIINSDVKQYLIKNGFKQEILLVGCPVITPKLDTQAKEYDMVFCGRFVKQKGVYDFVKVFQIVQKTKNDLKAVMIGSGPELTAIRELIQKNKLNIELTGYVESQQKFEAIAKSRIFVFPSFEEGWGIAIAEAMQIGILVIAYNLKVYEEVFKGNILTAPLGDIEQLAGQVYAELNKLSSKPSQDFVARSRVFANQFDLKIIADQEYQFLTN